MKGERSEVAAFLTLYLVPVLDELGFLSRQVLGHAEGTRSAKRLRATVDRIDALHRGAVEAAKAAAQ